jgi:AcrR family transcriptional regulator
MSKLARPKKIAGGTANRPVAAGRRRPATDNRSQKAAARREAILAAALDEFSARGFAEARLDDVARKAGVAKGTIYLHFADKEALFQELVRTMISPLVAALVDFGAADRPIRAVLEQVAELFVGSVGTRRREVAQLVLSEGHRFPELAEFYYREVVERAMTAMRTMLERAIARGEIPNAALARFPQLVVAPGILSIIWGGLFDRFQHLDVAAMMRTHIAILLGQRSGS